MTPSSISQLRARLGDTLLTFADRIGCSVSTVRALEAGQVKPTGEVFQRLSELMKSRG